MKINRARKKYLIVSNMYPSVHKKYSGIFVKNQYEELKRNISKEETLDIFYLERKMTGALGSMWKYLMLALKFFKYYFTKYDVVHLHYFYPLIFNVWIYKCIYPGCKLIVTFHGSDINRQVNKRNGWLFSLLAKKIDCIISVGDFISEQVEIKLKKKTDIVLSVGVNSNVFFPKKTEKVYDFIFVGSFLEIKGVDLLLQAIKSMEKSVKYCIVGKGKKYEFFFEELKREGYNICLKIDQSHEEISTLYCQSKFLVLPSRTEGFSTVTVEAMYCGVPVITSNIPQFKEQIIPSVNGFMFDLQKKDTLTATLKYAMNISKDRYNELVEGALSSFKEISLKQVCEKLIKIYRQ